MLFYIGTYDNETGEASLIGEDYDEVSDSDPTVVVSDVVKIKYDAYSPADLYPESRKFNPIG